MKTIEMRQKAVARIISRMVGIRLYPECYSGPDAEIAQMGVEALDEMYMDDAAFVLRYVRCATSPMRKRWAFIRIVQYMDGVMRDLCSKVDRRNTIRLSKALVGSHVIV